MVGALGRLVRGHRVVPTSARPADPAHGDHPAPQGPDRPVAGRVRADQLLDAARCSTSGWPAPTSAGGWVTGWPTSRMPAKAGEGVGDLLRGALEVLDDRDVASALETLVVRRVRATPVAPLVGKAIDLAVEGGHHQRLLDAVLKGLDGFLDDNKATFRARLEHESPWWIPESDRRPVVRQDLRGGARLLRRCRRRSEPRGAPLDRRASRRLRRAAATRSRAAGQGRGAEDSNCSLTPTCVPGSVRCGVRSSATRSRPSTTRPASFAGGSISRWRRSVDGSPSSPSCRPRSTIG